jgi:hypothetical protein
MVTSFKAKKIPFDFVFIPTDGTKENVNQRSLRRRRFDLRLKYGITNYFNGVVVSMLQ